MKSVDKGATEKEIDQNGSHFYVFNGSGVDKRAGTKVKFLVGIFAAGDGKAGIVYADYDAVFNPDRASPGSAGRSFR